MKRTFWLSAAVGVAAIGTVGWFAAPTLDELRRSWEVLQPLTDEELEHVDACEDPGWGALTKILEQDLADSCPPLWFAQSATHHLQRRPQRRLVRLTGVAHDSDRPVRARARAGLSLAVEGHELPPELAAIVQHPQSGVAISDLVSALAAEPESPDWLDPWLAMAVQHQRASEAGDPSTLILQLRIRAARDGSSDDPDLAALVAQALDVLEIDGATLARARERAIEVRPIAHLAPAVQELARNPGCDQLASAPCARHLASALETLQPLSADSGQGPAPDGALRALAQLAAVRDGRDGEAARTELAVLGAFAAYIGGAAPAQRADRLRAAVLGVGPVEERASRPPAAGVLDALASRRAMPWTSAALAQALGSAAGLDVSVGWEGDSLVLVIGEQTLRLDACGRTRVPPVGEGQEDRPIAPWPRAAVLAQAALEAAADRHRAGDPDRAARLAGYALRLDPIGADPARLAFLPPAGSAAAAVADVLAAHGSSPTNSALAPRKTRAIHWSVERDAPPACGVPPDFP